MDHIDEHLTTTSENVKYSPAIRAALALGKVLLNKYYDMTDHSEVYRIAMGEYLSLIIVTVLNSVSLPVLHPRHKLQYFRDAEWETDWIDDATDIVCAEFERAYAALPVDEIVDDLDSAQEVRDFFNFFSLSTAAYVL
jgi:hypothetical protein